MSRIPKGTEELNRKALELGIEYARDTIRMTVEVEDYEDSSD